MENIDIVNDTGGNTTANGAVFEEAYGDMSHTPLPDSQSEEHLPVIDFQPESDQLSESDGDRESNPDELSPSPYLYSTMFKLFEEMGFPADGWQPTDESQSELIENALNLQPELSLVPQSILDGESAFSAGPVNEFLRAKEFDIQLEEANTPSVYVAATITLEGKWNGTEQELQGRDGNDYPGFVKPAEAYFVDGNPVIKIYTDPETGFEMYVTPTDANLEGDLAYELAEKLTPSGKPNSEYDRIHMPMVDLKDQRSLDEIIGLDLGQDDYEISQALLQTILQLDQNGFEARQALAATASIKMARPTPQVFELDSRFLVFFTHPDMSKPLLAIPVSEENWKRPDRD